MCFDINRTDRLVRPNMKFVSMNGQQVVKFVEDYRRDFAICIVVVLLCIVQEIISFLRN